MENSSSVGYSYIALYCVYFKIINALILYRVISEGSSAPRRKDAQLHAFICSVVSVINIDEWVNRLGFGKVSTRCHSQLWDNDY